MTEKKYEKPSIKRKKSVTIRDEQQTEVINQLVTQIKTQQSNKINKSNDSNPSK